MNIIPIPSFIKTIIDIHEQSPDRNFCFVIGSGASKKSGIPIGEVLANVWFKEIKRKNPEGFENWLIECKINTKDIPSNYGAIFSKRFEIDKQLGYGFLIDIMKNAKPSVGHIFLAQILGKILETCVITTNFDSLIETAIYQYTDKTPLICGHESLSGYAKPSDIHPLIIKIHHDVLLSPKNSSKEIKKLAHVWEEPLNKIFTNYIPIVIGYGGNDGSLMGYFKKMKNPSNFFWCILKNRKPSKRVIKLVETKEGHFIEINSFDEIMIEMFKAFYKVETLKIEDITKIAKGRVKKFKKDIEVLKKQSEETEYIESKKEMSAFEYAVESENEPDYEKRKAIYLKALKKYPKSAWLWNDFTYFLHFVTKDYEHLEEYYLKALSIEPEDAINNGNYAIFLNYIKKDKVEAEKHYRKALSIEPEDAYINGIYATFLHFIKRDYVEVKKQYLKALSIEPENANKNGNYANFLTGIKKDKVEAEKYYRKALIIKPEHQNINGNFASFLLINERKKEATNYLEKAFKLNNNEDNGLLIELWFYKYAHYFETEMESEKKIDLLLENGIRSIGRNLDMNLEVAIKNGHPNPNKLKEFAERITKE